MCGAANDCMVRKSLFFHQITCEHYHYFIIIRVCYAICFSIALSLVYGIRLIYSENQMHFKWWLYVILYTGVYGTVLIIKRTKSRNNIIVFVFSTIMLWVGIGNVVLMRYTMVQRYYDHTDKYTMSGIGA